MDSVSKSQLKAKMFEYFRNVEASGKPLIVTDNGEPVIQIIKFQKKKKISELFAQHRSNPKLSGDVEGSILDEWEEK